MIPAPFLRLHHPPHVRRPYQRLIPKSHTRHQSRLINPRVQRNTRDAMLGVLALSTFASFDWPYDDAHGFGGGGVQKGREEQLGDEGVREVVYAELNLVAVGGEARGHGHDAGVAEEDVNGAGGEELHGGMDGMERGEVHGEEG
ncbi:hypothetical protein ACMFMF_008156 [Clarireedia jacksonii]